MLFRSQDAYWTRDFVMFFCRALSFIPISSFPETILSGPSVHTSRIVVVGKCALLIALLLFINSRQPRPAPHTCTEFPSSAVHVHVRL
jgi:hypothetical protein